jgi:hypothetical protein
MSIGTYAELQTAIANWLGGRTDLTSRITEWIALFEARFNRVMRTREMEARYTATLAQYMATPTSFAGFRRLQIDTSPVQVLELKSPEWIADNYPSPATGRPKVYAVIGSEIQFAPAPDSSTYTLAGVYYTRLAALSASNTTNWLLTYHPDLYLYGSLVESQAYTNIDERFPLWQGKYDSALAELKAMDKRDRWSGSLMVARSGTGNP